MGGRLSLFTPQSVLEDRFQVRAVDPHAPRYNIAPGEPLAIVPNSTTDALTQARWGYIPDWMPRHEDWPAPAIARAESVTTNPAFRQAFMAARCLVIADGFYVWGETTGEGQPYRAERPDSAPFPIAGLWQPTAGDDTAGTTVAILTADAIGVVGRVTDRMPVILDADEEVDWLQSSDRSTLRSMLVPAPSIEFDCFPVSESVNDPAVDHSGLVQPIDIGRRSIVPE